MKNIGRFFILALISNSLLAQGTKKDNEFIIRASRVASNEAIAK